MCVLATLGASFIILIHGSAIGSASAFIPTSQISPISHRHAVSRLTRTSQRAGRSKHGAKSDARTDKPKCIVVGAGIGGLVTAGRLAREGFDVTVLEKNSEAMVGGRVGEELVETSKGRFRFDTGASLFLMPEIFEETFSSLGVALHDAIDLRKVEPPYMIFYEDGTALNLTMSNRALLKEQLDQLEDDGYDKFMRYLDAADGNRLFGVPNFIQFEFSFDSINAFLKSLLSMWPLSSHHTEAGRFFSNPKLQALVTFQDLYVGLSPYSAPAVFSLLQAIEFKQGVFYPVGGYHTVAKKLLQIVRSLGVKVHFNTNVKEILVSRTLLSPSGYEAEGVLIDKPGRDDEAAKLEASLPRSRLRDMGKTAMMVSSDIVVVNADLPFAEEHLLKTPPALPSFAPSIGRDFSQWDYSTSVVALYWSFKDRLPLNHHNIFLSSEYRTSWASLFDTTSNAAFNASAFNFYVHASSRTDPSACPEGCDNIMVLVPVPALDERMSADEQQRLVDRTVSDAREGVLRRMEAVPGMENIRSSLLHEFVRSPMDWKRLYNLRRGAVFGLAHPLRQLVIFRPGPKHPTIGNLYAVGASARPGNGVPLVLVGAKQTAERIVKDFRRRFGSARFIDDDTGEGDKGEDGGGAATRRLFWHERRGKEVEAVK